MESVPFQFCDSVVAMWKCCEQQISCPCREAVFEDSKWDFMKVECTSVVIGYFDQEWMYGIRDPKNLEIFLDPRQYFNLQTVRIAKIEVCCSEGAEREMTPLTADSLDFLSYLSNEPELQLSPKQWNIFNTPVGSMLQQWLEERWFARVTFMFYHTTYNRLIEKQFSRRKPTSIGVSSVVAGDDSLKERLKSGHLRIFYGRSVVLSSETMTTFIAKFLENPEDYKKNNFRIGASFDTLTAARLVDMCRRGLGQYLKGAYVFGRQSPQLRVLLREDNLWLITVLEN